MKIFKLFLAVVVVASLLAAPRTTSFARDTVSDQGGAGVHVVKRDEAKKEQGFFEKVVDVTGGALKTVLNFFSGGVLNLFTGGGDKGDEGTGQKVAPQTPLQPVPQFPVDIPQAPPEPAAKPAEATVMQTAQEIQMQTAKIETQQVQQQAQPEPQGLRQTVQPKAPAQVQTIPPPAPASPSATHAASPAAPVITVTQAPAAVAPQQPVERKDDVFGLSTIELKPTVVEEDVEEPVIVDDRKTGGELNIPKPAVTTGQNIVIPQVAEGAREIEVKIETAETPTVATVVQTPTVVQIPRIQTPSDQGTAVTEPRAATTPTTTTVSGGTRTTTTTPTRETAAVTTDRRTTTTEQPARTTATTRETAPAQTETAAVEAHVETGECPPNHTERFEGELTMMTATDRYAVIDTLDNRDALNSRTFVVSLCGEGKIECPAVTDRQTATVAETTIRTTTETDRRTLSATTGATTGGAALAERATAPRTITMAETITDTAALQQAQTISDTLRAEMLTQCPTIQRTPHAAIDAETGARFVTTTGDRTTYALGNSLKTFILLKTSGEEAPPEDVTPPQGEEEPVVEAPAPVVVPPKLDVLVEPADCQATLKATVFCSGTTDCTADYVIDAVVTSGKTVLLGSVTRVDDQTFLITPPKEGDEPAKGLSISLNKAELTGPVTITVTAKKGDEAPLEHMVNDVPNKDDLIAKCMQAKTEAAGDIPKAYDGTRPEQMPTGGSDISGGGWLGVGCSLVRR